MFCRTFIFAFLTVGALAVNLEDIFDANRHLVKRIVTAVCKTAGVDNAEDKAEQLFKSVESFANCVSPLVDFDTLKSEIEAAKPNGTLHDVSKKYCTNNPALKTCLHTLIDAASPCMESAERERPLAKNATDQFIDYICYNDGNRITQFLSENGPECIISKGKEIAEVHTCFRPQIDTPLENFLSLTLKEKCRIIDRQNNCILKSLKTCAPPTPGYLLEDLVTYARKGSVCNDALPLPGSDSDRGVPESTWPAATRTTWPAATRTTWPATTRTTWPAANTTTLPTFLLKLYVTVKVEYPETNSTVTTLWKN